MLYINIFLKQNNILAEFPLTKIGFFKEVMKSNINNCCLT